MPVPPNLATMDKVAPITIGKRIKLVIAHLDPAQADLDLVTIRLTNGSICPRHTLCFLQFLTHAKRLVFVLIQFRFHNPIGTRLSLQSKHHVDCWGNQVDHNRRHASVSIGLQVFCGVLVTIVVVCFNIGLRSPWWLIDDLPKKRIHTLVGQRILALFSEVLSPPSCITLDIQRATRLDLHAFQLRIGLFGSISLLLLNRSSAACTSNAKVRTSDSSKSGDGRFLGALHIVCFDSGCILPEVS